MIGTRAAVSAVIAVLGVAIVLGPRLPDPGAQLLAERLVHQRVEVAQGALDDLHAALVPGLEAARTAAAAVVSSPDPPGPELTAAARIVEAAEALVPAARDAVASLAAAAGTMRPAIPIQALGVPRGELAEIARQLVAVAAPADAFTELRLAATGLPAALEGALDAIDRGALDEASALLDDARADHETVSTWDGPPPTLPVWMATTSAMISAVEAILAAVRLDDTAAQARAAESFAALADDAAAADRALRIAIGEAGPALTASPIGRLGTALAEIEVVRSAVADLAEAVSR